MEDHKGTLAVMLLWEETNTSCRIPKVPWRCFGAFRESPDLVKVHLKRESRFPTLEPEWSEMMLEEVSVQRLSGLTPEAEEYTSPQSRCAKQASLASSGHLCHTLGALHASAALATLILVPDR